MSVRGKQELREIFVTGAIPTQQDFTDFIDSYIASINGNMPNMDGDVEVPIPFTVNPGIPVDGAPNLYPLGRSIGTFDYVPGENAYVDSLFEGFNIPETTITVITDRFGNNGQSIIIQQTDVMQDGAFIPTLTRSSNIEQTEWNPLQFIASIRKINGQSPDLNGEINIDSGPQGMQGVEGPQGPQGPKGDKGDKGEKGERGDTGAQGPQGPIGATGTQGVPGIQGLEGERGPQGERGQGLDIEISYQTLAEANADIANIPDSSFVYISNDENNEGRGTVYFKHENATTLEEQFVAEGIKGDKGEPGERGLQGPEGVQGSQGPRGPQGVPGIQGPRGDKGDKGDSITVKGELSNEGELPLTGENGDAYWIEGRLYVWSNDPALVSEPTWIRGTDLTGPQGPQGLQGATGHTPTLNNATTTTKGVVQIGEGLNVSSGVVSAQQKEYWYASGSSPFNWTLSTSNTRLTMAQTLNRGIAFSGNTFTLKGGKVYKIDLSFGVTTSATTGVIRIGIFNATTNASADGNKIAVGTSSNDRSKTSSTAIVAPTTDTNYYIGIEANSPAGNFMSYSQTMTIVEI